MTLLRISLHLLCIAGVATLVLSLMPPGSAEGLPPLEVLTPREHERTNNTSYVITGITSPNATVNVTIENTYGDRMFAGLAREDGSFSVSVELYEDYQTVTIAVTDAHGGTSTVLRNVTCDIELPHMILLRPPTTPFYTNQTSYTIVVQQTCECQYWVTIGGVEVLNTGVARRTVDLVEGENRFEVRVRDQIWNELVLWAVIFSDTTPPVLEPNWSVGEEVVTNHALLRFGGDVTGATRINVTLNGLVHPGIIVAGDPNASRRWYCDLDLGPADGGWDTTVRAADTLGNVAEGTVHIVLDTTPPAILLDYAPYTLVARVQINGTTEAGIDTVRINEQDYAVTDGFVSVLQPLKHGWNTVFLQADDAVGNHGTAKASVFCSLRPPFLAIVGTTVVSGESARIRGTTDRYVHNVTVGTEVFPVINGTFDATVNLTGREDTLVVTVQDPAGVERAERVDVGDGAPGPGIAASVAGLSCAAILLMARRRGHGHGAAHPR